MDLENAAVEKMAREYRAALAGSTLVRGGNAMESAAERAVTIVEEQLDLIDALLNLARGNRQVHRQLSYLKNLKSSSVIFFSRLAGREEYIPSFRQNDLSGNMNMRLLEQQINLFVLLDTLSRMADTINLSLLENRALGVINAVINTAR